MAEGTLRAILLVCIMLLSGCTFNEEESIIDLKDNTEDFLFTSEWAEIDEQIIVGELFSTSVLVLSDQNVPWNYELTITKNIGEHLDYSVERQVDLIIISFIPSTIGQHVITLEVNPLSPTLVQQNSNFIDNLVIEILPPVEYPAVIGASSSVIIEQYEDVSIQGSLIHSNLDSCYMFYNFGMATMSEIDIGENGVWDFIITIQNNHYTVIEITSICGVYSQLESFKNITLVFIEIIEDADEDGVIDELDYCKNGESNWVSNPNTDYDQDGCKDITEDIDDDNDGVDDYFDSCMSSLGWVSDSLSDYDSDGCDDTYDDDDDDNDGIKDTDDFCPAGANDWDSNFYNDWDQDGCRDIDEDSNDDNDDYEDIEDDCPYGESMWSASDTTDFDLDGCHDQLEDDDDDNDMVYDYNETGAILDQCPRTPSGAPDIDEYGCASTERDTDGDGVNDHLDECEGTPIGLLVNNQGCADLDNDGIFANIDNCSNTPAKWTVDEQGCTVNQLPIQWTTASTLTGPMQVVPDFTLPTLGSSFHFDLEWNGYDVYLFLFKYTSSTGSSNANIWNQNPGTLIRNLPTNTHLFYGSFDASYHSDVINMRTTVESALNPAEEVYWQDRIHYIDIRANSISGGLGDMISSINNPLYMGIDRFQMARETGSLASYPTGGTDPLHLALEPQQWNAEFPAQIRLQDSGLTVVDIMDFEWHSGGWGGGYSSKRNASMPSNITQFDTLEIFHEHACDERSNRHQNSDGTEGGCHEWDYEANMYLCDRVNYNTCNVEFLRWITTYGREGRWLTDATPYLFMLDSDEERQFRYGGANRGSLTIKLLFSNWGESDRPLFGEYAFSGGQFDGTYNDESKYSRQYNFSMPNNASRVEIVATITGHGFNQDNENCAEFCNHEHHYSLNGFSAAEYHPIANSIDGCKNLVDQGVVANQYGSWPYGRAGWCPGQDVKQWRFDITSWVNSTSGAINNLVYQGLFNGQEYSPSDGVGNGARNIHAEIWLVFYD